MPNERFRAAPALAPLKVFQRRTVDYVFDRLYGQDDPVRQFLVADEVGLGKTMVARGVIARMIEHLWDTTKRIDILYICSNQAIAAQNLNRLNVLGRRELALPTRMTLVPLQLRDQVGLDANKVNFISLTPGTTFDLRSATGVTQERALLCHLLRDLVTRPRGLHNLLQVTPASTAGTAPSTISPSKASTSASSSASAATCRRIATSSRNSNGFANSSRAAGTPIPRK
jgi:hypothetical protein